MRLGYINIFSGDSFKYRCDSRSNCSNPLSSLHTRGLPPEMADPTSTGSTIYPKGLFAPNKGAHPQILETTWHSPNTTSSST